MLQAMASAPPSLGRVPEAPEPCHVLHLVDEKVLLLQEQVMQLTQHNSSLQLLAEAAEVRVLELQLDARGLSDAMERAEDSIAQIRRFARERETALQQQADAAQGMVQTLVLQLEQAQLKSHCSEVHLIAQALSGGVCTASHAELAAATSNFAVSSILGRGGFGPVYRGKWRGRAVAIKRLDQASPPASSLPLNHVFWVEELSFVLRK
jgi:sulfur transfer complex TusBCD TusB component (DsrH family)